ncbi:hypothetical protein [Paenibacillus sp. QZ-Y1]|uniref:hypothetical protein n=1 Tax=Paenibacillus sp. QZ-Y1 TaxID=3414511 RepID=UPI003F7A0C9B
MISWKMLFLKEIYGSKQWIQLNILLLILLIVYSLISNTTDTRLFILLGIILFHVAYLPCWAFYSIFKELKEHTFTHWLNLPHSGLVLLSAKFLSGLSLMAVSLAISMLTAILPALFGLNAPHGLDYALALWASHKVGLFFLITTISSIFAGAQVILAFMLAKSLHTFRMLAAFGFLALLSLLQKVISSSPLLLKLTQWGPLFSSPAADWWGQMADQHYDIYVLLQAVSNIMNLMYVGVLVIGLITSILFLWLSSKLLDKYVHV